MAASSKIDDQNDDIGPTSSLFGSSSPSVVASSPVISVSDTALILPRFGYTLSAERVSCADCGFMSNSEKFAPLDHMRFNNLCCVAQCHLFYCLRRDLELFRNKADEFRSSLLEFASVAALPLKDHVYRYERKRFHSLKVGNIPQASLLAKGGLYLRPTGEIACYACDVADCSFLGFQDRIASHVNGCPFKLGLGFNVPRIPVPRYKASKDSNADGREHSFREGGIQWKDEEISKCALAGFSYFHNSFNRQIIICGSCKLKMDLEVVPENADLMLEHASNRPKCVFVTRLPPVEVVFMNLCLNKQGRPFLDIDVGDLRKELEAHPITQGLPEDLLNFLASMKKDKRKREGKNTTKNVKRARNVECESVNLDCLNYERAECSLFVDQLDVN